MRLYAILALAVVCLSGSAQGQVSSETVIDNLYNPTGIAIQPETGHIFVSDSGNLKVIRVVDGKAEDVIVNFPKDVYGTGPTYDVGPMGLAFLDKETLVVGGGGKPDGEDALRVYKISEAGAPPLDAEAMEASFTLPPEGDLLGEGNFYALAVTNAGVYATSNGDDTKGWVTKADREGNKLSNFRRYISTKEATQVDAPVAITLMPLDEGESADGPRVLVVGQMGEITVPGDGLLTFYDEEDGSMLANFETGLHDITALAYGPNRGRLFALDFAWFDPSLGGLFKLVAVNDGQGCEAREMLKLDKPTAMVFAPDGTLYVTVVGTQEEGSQSSPGQLLKITGLDVEPPAAADANADEDKSDADKGDAKSEADKSDK